jgi:hypothetical protein
MESYGAFPDSGPLAEDSATKLKKGQLNVCIVFVYLCSVYDGILFSSLQLKFVPDGLAISVSC